MAQESRPRTDVTSTNQSRGPDRRSAVQGDVPGSSADTDKHCKNKAATTALIALQLTLWPH